MKMVLEYGHAFKHGDSATRFLQTRALKMGRSPRAEHGRARAVTGPCAYPLRCCVDMGRAASWLEGRIVKAGGPGGAARSTGQRAACRFLGTSGLQRVS